MLCFYYKLYKNQQVKLVLFEEKAMNRTKAYENFQEAVENSKVLIKLCGEYKNEGGKACEKTQGVLKRSSIILLMTAWETYVEDVCQEIFNSQYKVIQGSKVGNYIRKQFEDYINRLHNPTASKVAQLFNEFFGFNVTNEWRWDNYNDPDDVRCKLNKLLEKRGEIAHRSNPENLLSKLDIEKSIRFICKLVDKTDEIIQKEIIGI